ncbi:hypothetical protein, partial [Streptomyces dysideae]|uniref:hypothetical protein n=1 Tax=Streptomyces dysideae TaxID=909626 RepID=UPI001F34A8C6
MESVGVLDGGFSLPLRARRTWRAPPLAEAKTPTKEPLSASPELNAPARGLPHRGALYDERADLTDRQTKPTPRSQPTAA